MQPITAKNEAKCEQIRPRLSRLLDNDVTAGAATDITAHLHACVPCRSAYDEMRALRAALRSLGTPADSEVVRERVFQKLERAVRTGETTRGGESLRRGLWNWHGVLASWRPVVATLATAGAALGFVFLRPVGIPTAPPVPGNAPGAEAVSGPRLSLPQQNQMQQLFELHDQRTQAAADEDSATDALGGNGFSAGAANSDDTAALTSGGGDSSTGVVEAL